MLQPSSGNKPRRRQRSSDRTNSGNSFTNGVHAKSKPQSGRTPNAGRSVATATAPGDGIQKPAGLTKALRLDALVSAVREKRVRKVLLAMETGAWRTVHDLAVEVRLSPSHLQRLFKQETGVLISTVLSEYRLQKAAHLLRCTHLEVKEVAHVVGYCHHSSFVRAFQRRFGQAPRRYREECSS